MRLVRRTRLQVAAAVALATTAAACGDDPGPNETTPPGTVALREIVDVPPRYQHEHVTVSGRVVPVGDVGFFLRDDRWALFVQARPATVRRFEAGQRVRVRGEVTRMSRFNARQIREALTLGLRRQLDGLRHRPVRSGSPSLDPREVAPLGTA
jgi:hypothetical protein